MNIERIRHKVAKAQSNKRKEKNSVPLCLCAFVPDKKGFTLMELLVVIAIIGILAGVLLPTLNKARIRGGRAACMGNLKVIGEAFNMYNIDQGSMPPTITLSNPSNPYLATNQIQNASPLYRVGLGYFYDDPSLNITSDNYIEDFGVYVCPASDYANNAKTLKADWVANNNTYSAYIYRAESGYRNPPPNFTLLLSDAKSAIVMDYNNASGGGNYNHNEEYVNILFKNGYVKGFDNLPDPNASSRKLFTIDPTFSNELDRVFENADKEQ